MEIYLVGGAVRDQLLNLPVTERDWVVVGATANELLAQGYQQVGKSFPVFLHPHSREEYALARTERKSGQGYTGFTCYFAPDVTLEDDLQRRDLTINAIAQTPSGELVDPFHGLADLNAGILRHVSEAFREDPLRVLRVARFAARFASLGFQIAPETLHLMQQMSQSGELATLVAERVWKETEKALQTQDPQVYFQVLRDCGALRVLFPEIDKLFDCAVLAGDPSDTNAGVQSLNILSMAAKLSAQISVRFAALCYHLAKSDRSVMAHADDAQDNSLFVEQLCQRLRVPNVLTDLAKWVVKYQDIVNTAPKQPPELLLALFNAIDSWRKPCRLEQLLIVCEANARVTAIEEASRYLAGDYLRQAYQLANAVSVKEIVASGLKGAAISQAVAQRRCQVLHNWQQEYALKVVNPQR